MVTRIVTTGHLRNDKAAVSAAPPGAKETTDKDSTITTRQCLSSALLVVVFFGTIVLSVTAASWIRKLLPGAAGKPGLRIHIFAFVAVWLIFAAVVFIWRGFRDPRRSGLLRIAFVAALVLLGVFVGDNLRATGKGFLDELFFLGDIEEDVGDSTLGSAFLLLAIIVCTPILLAFSAVHVAYYVLFFLGAVAICIVFLGFEALIGVSRKKAATSA